MNDTDYVETRVDDQIDWYDRKSAVCQKWFKRLRGIELIAAALIPFVSGLSNTSEHQFALTMFAGLLGVLVTVAAGLLSLNQYQERWVQYRATAEALKQEKFLYLAKSDPYAEGAVFPRFVRTVEALLSKETTRWGQYMQSGTGKPSAQPSGEQGPADSGVQDHSGPLDEGTSADTTDASEQPKSATELGADAAQQILPKEVADPLTAAVREALPNTPLQRAIQAALPSFGLVLGAGAPPLGLVFALATVAARLGREGFAKWKSRLLHLPYTPSADRLAVVDANTGFALFQQSSIFAAAFQKSLGDRKFLKNGALDFMGEKSADRLWEAYRQRGKFANRSEFDEGLREFRQAALAAELEEVVEPDWVAEAGGFRRLISDVDAIHVDPQARTDLSGLLDTIEKAQAAGEPIDARLQDIRSACSS